jgi:hypothetical protein
MGTTPIFAAPPLAGHARIPECPQDAVRASGRGFYFGALLSEGGGGGGLVVESAGGVVDDELESGGVVVPGAGGVVDSAGGDVVVDWSLGVADGEVDCCFEQADIATSAPRHKMSKLRFIDHLTV